MLGLRRSGVLLGLAGLTACAGGIAEGERWIDLGGDAATRLSIGRHTGDGIPVTPGTPVETRCDVPPESVLRFFTVGVRYEADPAPEETEALFRVRLNGSDLWSARQSVLLGAMGEWHAIPLPETGLADATFELSVEGGAQEAGFLAPVIGPREVSAHDARPNVVLFLADTFRADNLSAYGGTHGAAPHLDRLADESVAFLRTWSPAAWTLPSHGSLFTGLYPPQHGAERNRLPLDDDLTTIAELLKRNGYRTGAITDSGFVAADFGLDQGFAWFEERLGRDLRGALASAREFLAADDGRPAFLFVQTYRTHHPYTTGPEEDEADWNALVSRAVQELEGRDEQPYLDDMLAGRFADELHRLYLAGVSGMDAVVGPWIEEVRGMGLLENGYLILTSDHGEAFAEHGEIKHGGLLWEEKLRVPLLIHGSGLAPRTVREAASLVDLPRTIASLTGLAAPDAWGGVPLLDLEEDRPIFAFGAELKRYPRHLAVVRGPAKLLARHDLELLRQGRLERAFDLAQDPGEKDDLAQSAPRMGALCVELAPRVAELSRPVALPEEIQLDRDMEALLNDLGYGGGE